MKSKVELRLFNGDECKIIAYEWDGLKLIMVETTYDETWVSSQLSDSPPDDGWWVDEHDYDNTFEDMEDNRWLPECPGHELAAEMSPSYHGHERCQCKDEEEI